MTGKMLVTLCWSWPLSAQGGGISMDIQLKVPVLGPAGDHRLEPYADSNTAPTAHSPNTSPLWQVLQSLESAPHTSFLIYLKCSGLLPSASAWTPLGKLLAIGPWQVEQGQYPGLQQARGNLLSTDLGPRDMVPDQPGPPV